MGLLNHNPLRADQYDQYLLGFAFEGRATNGPCTILSKDYGSDVLIARTAAGIHTITFAAYLKPFTAMGWGSVGESSSLDASVVEYNPTTGVATVRTFDAAGAATDATNLTVNAFLLCSRNSLTDLG